MYRVLTVFLFLTLFTVSVCARRSSGTSGVIASPRFPNNYPRNTNCEHVIQTDPGKRIMIRFTDFTLEPDRLGCSNDVLTVQDGNSYRSPLLQTLCGYNLPSLIRSSGSKVFLRFRTNARNEFKGFRLEWWTEPIPLTTSPVITTTDSVAPQITTTAVYPTDGKL